MDDTQARVARVRRGLCPGGGGELCRRLRPDADLCTAAPARRLPESPQTRRSGGEPAMKRRSLTRLLILGAEIVSGEQTFSPGLPCTRGQTVTLLYRMENPEK